MPAQSAKTPLPFGTWPSPITPELAARSSRRLGSVQAAGGSIYWSEVRPDENGRQVIVRAGPEGRPEDVLPKPFSARSQVHEYGGGEFLAAAGSVYFTNSADQQVYYVHPGQEPVRLTNAARTRFADFAFDERRQQLIAVAEIHPAKAKGARAQPRNLLVAIALAGRPGEMTEIATGRDFYASPRLSPDGNQLAFLTWDLPDMPWDSATLHVAPVHTDGTLSRAKTIAGGSGSAAFQPEWGPDGDLYFVWDESGWGALYRWREGKRTRVWGKRGQELSRPQWAFGMRSYALHPDGRLASVFLERGTPLLEVRAPVGDPTPYRALQSRVAHIGDPVATGKGFAALVSTPAAAPAVMRITRAGFAPIVPTPPAEIASGYISQGEVLEFRNARGQTVYGIHYAPRSPTHRGPARSAPPALVLAHGGPTSMSERGLKLRLQFYTSRGFAVLDVNYSGSTGYGRAYRERLDGQWGVADVADCVAGARHLAKAGLADGKRIAIAGGSAGGYTTLMALATSDVFAAGSSHYGISDLALLLAHTHKFESGYLHRLLGTTPDSWKETFAARSPVNLIGGITAPLILFQGLDDKVVPPEQSRLIAGKLATRGVDVALHEFAGEGHGFRKGSTIIAMLEAELAFLQRVLSPV